MGVVETKVKDSNISSTAKSCFPSHWLSVHNYSVGPVARIFLGWDPTIFGNSILFSSDQLIVSEFLPLDGSASFVLSVVYGHNRAVDRRQLWDDMRTIANSAGTKPWVQMGDFNTVRAASERLVMLDLSHIVHLSHLSLVNKI
ncbi:hypothetical protein RHGRI_012990 [Rhododendron griersonianum]|uniref:Endonuclease/exonuclease/phosphatase domain-containing protein n=1 Tax=Rhododendron griersonianum TaxID=479676 RepID=A0AAV6K493_9ERIC|nr:hypothetical protein RHGRI_012990 [Rhododendron griersonianum]